MDEATKAALNEFVRQAIAAAQAGAVWSSEQAPLLVREWLYWYGAKAGLWMIAGTAMIMVARNLRKKAWAKSDGGDQEDWAGAAVVCGIGQILGCIILLANLFDVVKVTVAPRVVVIEQLATWVGQVMKK